MTALIALTGVALGARPVPAPDIDAVAADLLGAALASDEAYRELAGLCDGIGHRITGSPELDRAIDWGIAELTADGMTVRREPVTVPVWVRNGAKATLLGAHPRDLPILALGRSGATPPGGIDAEVVVVDSFAAYAALPDSAVAGRIVVWDVPFTDYGDTVAYRWSGAIEGAKRGAVASLVRSVTPISLNTPHTGVMGVEDGKTPLPAAALTIEDATALHRLAAAGPTRIHLEIGAQAKPDGQSANTVGERLGREHPEEIVVLGCHLDSWDVGQGAQDDGAGCAIVMEAGALLAALPVAPRRTVRVVLYTNEESGGAGGKGYLAAHAGERHVGVLEADTGAGRPLGFRVDVGENQAPDLAGLARLKGWLAPLGATQLEPGGAGADVGPLVESGVPGLGLINDMTGYWPIHHTMADTFDKIDPMALRFNVAAVTLAAWWLAEGEPIGRTAVETP
jgi:Zn-dependent M28 family amino/carboxypeptidase